MTGVELIAAERQRQVDVEGWLADHDDAHTYEELAIAAACYALPPTYRQKNVGGWRGMLPLVPHALWPWELEWWRPVGQFDIAARREPDAEHPRVARGDHIEARIRELVKAGALIAAEIDRLERTA